MKRAALLLCVLLVACGGQQPAPVPEQGTACQDEPQRLAQLAQDLPYISEEDAPFMPVTTPFKQLPATQQVAALAGVPSGAAEVQVVEFAEWAKRFSHEPYSVTEQARARDVVAEFSSAYSAQSVYRVHDTNNPAVWQIFVLGLGKCGVNGLKTYSVET